MRDESAAADDLLHDLIEVVLAAVGHPHERAGRKRSRPFRGEGALAVERVVHVDRPAVFVGSDGNAAAHVGDDEAAVRKGLSEIGRRAPGHRLLVQRVPDRAALDLRQPRDARFGDHFVDDDRIDDERTLAGGLHRNPERERRAEVARMRAVTAGADVPEHRFVHLVGSSGDRTQQASAPDDAVEFLRLCPVGRHGLHDLLETEFLLLRDSLEAADDVDIVPLGVGPDFLSVLEERNLRARRPGVDRKNLHSMRLQSVTHPALPRGT